MLHLDISASDEVQAADVTKKIKSWSLAPGVVPSTYRFFRVRGTPNIIGLPSDVAARVLAEKDRAKVRNILAPLIRREVAAARAGTPGGKSMILIAQSGDAMRQVTTAGPAKEQTTEGPVGRALRKQAGLSSVIAPIVQQVGAPTVARAAIGAGLGAAGGAAASKDGRLSGALKGGLVGGALGAAASPANVQKAVGAAQSLASRFRGAAPAAAPTRMLTENPGIPGAVRPAAPSPRAPVQPAPTGPTRLLADRGAPAPSPLAGYDIPRRSGPTKTILPSGPTISLGGPRQPVARGGMAEMLDNMALRGKAAAAPKGAKPWSLASSFKDPQPKPAMDFLRNTAQESAADAAKRNKKIQDAGAGGDVWTQKRASGPGMVMGAIGGMNSGARHGVASSAGGGVVGGLVGQYVLPIVEQALLAAGPDFALVARPAALLAAGISGEISGRLIGKMLQPEQEPQEQPA